LWVESRKRAKPRSTWLLKRELSQKGVADAIIVSLMGESSERGDDLSFAKDAIAKRIEKYRNLPRAEVYQKLGGFLARRGFSWDVSKAAIDALLKERYNDGE
jgi:regulatory protein